MNRDRSQSSAGRIPELSAGVLARMPSLLSPREPDTEWHKAPELRTALRECARVCRDKAKSFHWCSRALPAHRRHAAFAVYAFCRFVDDQVDERPGNERDPARMEAELMQELEDIEAGRSKRPFAPAFRETLLQYGIDRSLCTELIRGCSSDVGRVRYPGFPELEVYCYQVASTVGLMMARVFGLSNPSGIRRAVEMGIAMQLTNILRDVDEDYRNGRVYLPADELGEAGVGERDLAAGQTGEEWREFMRRQIQRARAYYRSGELGLVYLEDSRARFATLLMSRIYGGILDEIEGARYNVFGIRHCTSPARKLAITLGALLD